MNEQDDRSFQSRQKIAAVIVLNTVRKGEEGGTPDRITWMGEQDRVGLVIWAGVFFRGTREAPRIGRIDGRDRRLAHTDRCAQECVIWTSGMPNEPSLTCAVTASSSTLNLATMQIRGWCVCVSVSTLSLSCFPCVRCMSHAVILNEKTGGPPTATHMSSAVQPYPVEGEIGFVR